jgi:flagellar biosynthesis chaperone FliJ
MRAVLRVRGVRERDSRVQLVHALDAVRYHENEVARLQQALAMAARPTEGTVADFVTARQLMAGMAASVKQAEKHLETSRQAAAAAHQRWQADKAQMRAVELLLEERAARRAEERRRGEVREVDDVVGALQSHRSQTDKNQQERRAS